MSVKGILFQFNRKINAHAKKFSQPYLIFAIFGIITYPFYYFLWKYTASNGYENLSLRFIAVLLCILLAFKNRWPKKCKSFLPLFWYITILYSLPFLFTFFLLKNHMSYVWAMNTMTVLILLILILDLTALFIILPLGIFLGIVFFSLSGNSIYLPPYYMTILITYFSVLLFGSLFSYRKDQFKEREKRIAAEAANKAKTDFISNMQHDLATPFSGIHGSAEILYSLYAEKNPEIKEWVEPILTSCTQWEKVHYEILGSLQLENIAPYSLEKFYIYEEIYKISEMMSSLLHLKNIKFRFPSFESLEPLGQISTDRLKLNLILMSLIGNAINYTDVGEVKVNISKDDHYFIIAITDTGVGIPADKFDYIFEKFTKLSQSNLAASNFKGVGSGLYISRLYAQNLGGKITVSSELGKGSTFTLTLPITFN